ncbi:PEBP-like protein [Periconia macrospinosa]|uniref:PEBP-like protein n=1 Tax=Periconia macrospinosa TaxID=97972 RepID=A0A2V1DNQ5_9PLEO|nr:PEBP-like protein [Periconia macrospinosa]
MWLLKVIEFCLGRLFYKRRGYDDQCLFNSNAFLKHPKPSITITSPDCGGSGAQFTNHYSMFGVGQIPTLTWSSPSPADIKQYILVIEDPDGPLGHPNVHGIYCLIPPSSTSVSAIDLELLKEEDGKKIIKSGWRVGKNSRDTVYVPPRPPRGHGPHRYFFEIIALGEKLKPGKLTDVPTKEELAGAIDGKVVAWGLWVGVYESVM